MQNESRQAHWQNVYTSKSENEVSWFQESPAPSLALIAELDTPPDAAIIDIGGGASRLVDHLVDQGFRDISLLDLSAAALEAAKARLGERAGRHVGSSPTSRRGSRPEPMISGMTGQRSTSSPRSVTAMPISRASGKA